MENRNKMIFKNNWCRQCWSVLLLAVILIAAFLHPCAAAAEPEETVLRVAFPNAAGYTSLSEEGKPVGVCGEMGGDPLAATVLMGLGMRQLSMGAASIAAVKQMILSVSCAEAAEIAEVVCNLPTATEVKKYLQERIRL